jgi:hypothetical protein
MAETGDLIIKIGGDASKFKATIADVENSLKSFKANLGTTGLNIKIEALGFQETKSNIKGVADFAEVTLGAIKNKIKEVKAERLTISADPNSLAPFNIKLNQLNTTVKELEKAGILKNVPQEAAVAENSIQGISNKLSDLRKQRSIIDPDTNARAIVQINQAIEKLEEKLTNLQVLGKKVATPEGAVGGLNQITKGSKEAGRALTSLALVAQDLPFGFIGIQNNLPGVQQSFQSLNTAAEGSKGALKALGAALVGPAGIFLAFSAVTAAVTFAVQKYGSLSNALDALIGDTSKFSEIYKRTAEGLKEYNENLKTNEEIIGKAVGSQQGLLTKISALSKVVLDVTESEDNRKRALQGLQEIDKERFKNFDIEKGKYEGLKTAVDDLTRSIIAKATADAFAQQVSAAAVQFEQQRVATDVALKDLQEFERLNPRARKLFNEYEENFKNALEPPSPSGLVKDLMKVEGEFIKQQNELKKIGDEWVRLDNLAQFYAKNATKLEAIKPPSLDGNGTKSVFAPQIDAQDLDEAFNLNKIIANLTKYGNVLIDVNKTEAERKNALRELSEINPEYFNQFKIGKSSVADAKTQLEGFIRTLLVQKKAQEDALAAAKLNNEFRKNEEKGITDVGDKYRILNDEVSSLPQTMEDVEKAFKNANLNINKSLQFNFTGLDVGIETAIAKANSGFESLGEVYNKVFDDVIKKNKEIASSVEGYITQPMSTLFDILTDEGQTSWKDFGKVVIDTLKRIAVQAISTALAKTLANILAPGFGSISTEGLEAGFEALYGESIRGGGGQANFGGIRGNQGVNMSGQVVMTLRGADLVGAMNRTNTTISRVG